MGVLLVVGPKIAEAIAGLVGLGGERPRGPGVSACTECLRLARELGQGDHRRLPAIAADLKRHQQQDLQRPAA